MSKNAFIHLVLKIEIKYILLKKTVSLQHIHSMAHVIPDSEKSYEQVGIFSVSPLQYNMRLAKYVINSHNKTLRGPAGLQSSFFYLLTDFCETCLI